MRAKRKKTSQKGAAAFAIVGLAAIFPSEGLAIPRVIQAFMDACAGKKPATPVNSTRVVAEKTIPPAPAPVSRKVTLADYPVTQRKVTEIRALSDIEALSNQNFEDIAGHVFNVKLAGQSREVKYDRTNEYVTRKLSDQIGMADRNKQALFIPVKSAAEGKALMEALVSESKMKNDRHHDTRIENQRSHLASKTLFESGGWSGNSRVGAVLKKSEMTGIFGEKSLDGLTDSEHYFVYSIPHPWQTESLLESFLASGTLKSKASVPAAADTPVRKLASSNFESLVGTDSPYAFPLGKDSLPVRFSRGPNGDLVADVKAHSFAEAEKTFHQLVDRHSTAVGVKYELAKEMLPDGRLRLAMKANFMERSHISAIAEPAADGTVRLRIEAPGEPNPDTAAFDLVEAFFGNGEPQKLAKTASATAASPTARRIDQLNASLRSIKPYDLGEEFKTFYQRQLSPLLNGDKKAQAISGNFLSMIRLLKDPKMTPQQIDQALMQSGHQPQTASQLLLLRSIPDEILARFNDKTNSVQVLGRTQVLSRPVMAPTPDQITTYPPPLDYIPSTQWSKYRGEQVYFEVLKENKLIGFVLGTLEGAVDPHSWYHAVLRLPSGPGVAVTGTDLPGGLRLGSMRIRK